MLRLLTLVEQLNFTFVLLYGFVTCSYSPDFQYRLYFVFSILLFLWVFLNGNILKLHMSVIWSLRFSPHKRQRKVKIRICALPLVHTSKTFRSEPLWVPNVNKTLDRYTHFDHTTYFYNSTYKKILNKCNLLQTNE